MCVCFGQNSRAFSHCLLQMSTMCAHSQCLPLIFNNECLWLILKKNFLKPTLSTFKLKKNYDSNPPWHLSLFCECQCLEILQSFERVSAKVWTLQTIFEHFRTEDFLSFCKIKDFYAARATTYSVPKQTCLEWQRLVWWVPYQAKTNGDCFSTYTQNLCKLHSDTRRKTTQSLHVHKRRTHHSSYAFMQGRLESRMPSCHHQRKFLKDITSCKCWQQIFKKETLPT